MGRTLCRLGFTKLTARPRHHAPVTIPRTPRPWRLSKNFAATLDGIRATLKAGTALEIWWQDEARIGQNNKLTRRWAQRGTRPRAPQDQRTQSAYIFGAICPARGVGAALVMPRYNTEAMQHHLEEIALTVAPNAHAVVILDQAGWYTTEKLDVPANITLLPLPARCPELNPVENDWQFLRDNWLSNGVYPNYSSIVDHCCQAWNNLIEQPWNIMSIGLRQWAYGF